MTLEVELDTLDQLEALLLEAGLPHSRTTVLLVFPLDFGHDALHRLLLRGLCEPRCGRAHCSVRDRFQPWRASGLNTIDDVPPLSGKATFKNPPDGENLSATVIVNQTTGRGTFEALK